MDWKTEVNIFKEYKVLKEIREMKLRKPLLVACVLFAYLFRNDSFFQFYILMGIYIILERQ